MKLTANLKSTTEAFEIIIDEPDISLTYYAETLALNNTMFVTRCNLRASNVKLTKAQNKKYRELIVKELTESK